MCTVSFVPNARGFRIAMNRDEKRKRIRGLPPSIVSLGSQQRAIFPREPNGGIWIAVNDSGLCLALINWHQIERAPGGKPISRGVVIDTLVGCRSTAGIARRVKSLPLQQLRPFRLLVADSRKRRLVEWQWNLVELVRRDHSWRTTHWFSSGFNEREAERVRAAVCTHNGTIHSLGTLRKLHRSHAPRRGPLSICMHRPDAATVSYTEVAVTPRRATLRYADGPPCSARKMTAKSIAL